MLQKLLSTKNRPLLWIMLVGTLLTVSSPQAEIASSLTQPSVTVCPSGCDFSSIQAAIDSVADGSTINIGAGNYDETLVIVERASLSLVGEGADVVTVDGSSQQVNLRAGIFLSSSAAISISGITIRDAFRGIDARDVTGLSISESHLLDNIDLGILFVGSVAEVESTSVENTMSDPDGDSGDGISVFDNADTTDNNVIIRDSNITGSRREGITVSGNSQLTLEDSESSGNGANGLILFETATAVVRGSTFNDNAKSFPSAGISLFSDSSLELENSTLFRNTTDNIVLSNNASATIAETEISNSLRNSDGAFGRGVTLFANSSVTITESQILNNPASGIALVGAPTLTVSSSAINGSFDGILLFDDAKATITNNTMDGNDAGIITRGRSNATITSNTLTRHASAAIGLWDSSQTNISTNTISNNPGCGVDHARDRSGGVTGAGNNIFNNAGGNLCGDINSFPGGFGGGR